jgi:hypothetical protein
MAYVTEEARRQLLEEVAEATDRIGVALAALGAAYEELDDAGADRLEASLFRPVQTAYGRARRTHADFARRHGLPARDFRAATAPAVSHGIRARLDEAVGAVDAADDILAELQDSMLPVEVGDPELRAGLAEVRELVGGLRARARDFVRTLGR